MGYVTVGTRPLRTMRELQAAGLHEARFPSDVVVWTHVSKFVSGNEALGEFFSL